MRKIDWCDNEIAEVEAKLVRRHDEESQQAAETLRSVMLKVRELSEEMRAAEGEREAARRAGRAEVLNNLRELLGIFEEDLSQARTLLVKAEEEAQRQTRFIFAGETEIESLRLFLSRYDEPKQSRNHPF
jgi:hypothetical protein